MRWPAWPSQTSSVDDTTRRSLVADHPIDRLRIGLDNEAVRVAAGLRLGLTLCAPHRRQCGEVADQVGHHALICRRTAGRVARHAAINDIICRKALENRHPQLPRTPRA